MSNPLINLWIYSTDRGNVYISDAEPVRNDNGDLTEPPSYPDGHPAQGHYTPSCTRPCEDTLRLLLGEVKGDPLTVPQLAYGEIIHLQLRVESARTRMDGIKIVKTPVRTKYTPIRPKTRKKAK